MAIPKRVGLLCLLLLAGLLLQAGVAVPDYKDKYSNYVRQLEAGNTKINYRDFREQFLESSQYNTYLAQSVVTDSLRKKMWAYRRAKDYKAMIQVCQRMLSIDYTDMELHKVMHQSYAMLHDTVNSRKYHDIELGLLHSIIDSGDGQSCGTGWPVIKISEEYFILRMMDARLESQSLVYGDSSICDRMDVVMEDGSKRTYYFEISKLFEAEKKMFGPALPSLTEKAEKE